MSQNFNAKERNAGEFQESFPKVCDIISSMYTVYRTVDSVILLASFQGIIETKCSN